VFFDLTFVIDAYMEARVSTLFEISRFAGQVVTGLANGVAVVDRRHRIEYANEELLAIVGVSPGVLHRLPLRSALPFDGIDDLVMAARADAQGRRTTLYEFGDRHFRIAAIRLEHSVTGRDGLVALVLDDVSEVLQLGTALVHEQDRLDHILSSVQVLAWEMDRRDLTILAVSASSSELLGLRDVDAVGRPLLVDRIHEGDRERFSLACQGLELGHHDQLDHRIRTEEDTIWVRTALAATRAPSGAETVFGVTIPLATPSAVDSSPSDRLRGLLADFSRAARRSLEEAEEEDRLEGEWFTIDAVEPGRWFLDGLAQPLLVPRYLAEFARVGWRFRGDLVRVDGCWHLVVVDRVVGD
jgi:PAS domain-containing protein